MKRIPICVDFDGTCVEHVFPEIGPDVPFAVDSLRELAAHGFDIILFTMRSGDYLEAAVKWFEGHGIELHGVNVNPTQHEWTTSPKAYGKYFIDDAAIGVPLVFPTMGRPYVDWLDVMDIIKDREY